MIEINLIPDVKMELIKAQKMRSLVISVAIFISIVAVAIVVLMALYVFAGQGLRNGLANDSIDKKGKELFAVQDLSEILTVQNQLKNISALSNDRQINSRVFRMLEAIVPTGENAAKISQLSIDKETSTITLIGHTASFDSMEIFKKTVDAAEIFYTEEGDEEVAIKLASDINTSDTSFGEGTDGGRALRFTMTFVYPEELFSPATEGFSYRLVVNGNVTDSYLGVPRAIFSEAAKDSDGEEE